MTTRLPLLVLLLAAAPGFAQDRPARPRPAAVAPPPPLEEGKRPVVLDVVLAEFPLGKDAARPELDGPVVAVLTRLDELGKTGSVLRVRLNAVEGREAVYSKGGQEPLVSSTGFPGSRPTQRNVNYIDTGLKVNATAWVEADGVVTLDLTVSEARIRPAANPDDPATVDLDSVATRLRVPAGRAVAAQEVYTDGKAGRTARVVVVTAKLADPGK